MYKILLTCPPMIESFHLYKEVLLEKNLDVHIPSFTQVMTENELIKIIGNYDGWIIGDDPATQKVFEHGMKGKLKVVVKWGVGIDNVDTSFLKKNNIPFTNIPNVFGESVSDVGIGMLLSINRHLHNIHQEVMEGKWYKPCGDSLLDKKICLVGFGDIGRCSARKLLAFHSKVHVSDPGFQYDKNGKIICSYDKTIEINDTLQQVKLDSLEKCLENCDIIFITAALHESTFHLIDEKKIRSAKKGVKIINISRGPLVCETSVLKLLDEKFIDSVGFDVFETEPIQKDHPLKKYHKNIFGTHNGSNEIDGVYKTSMIAISKIVEFLNL